MTALINRLSGALGCCAAWLFVITGAMLCWEVVARYVFNAPTIWAAELSQLLLIWGTFLGAAMLLRDRQHITITIITGRLGSRGRQFSEALALAIIAVFSVWIAWHGFDIAYDSFTRSRSSGSMMNLPNWIAEAAIPLGFAALALQALLQLLIVLRNGPTALPAHSEGLH
jgi:TRAP-type C4-dicarboxylate transport system permease small subunit